jgi:hypothetical protein
MLGGKERQLALIPRLQVRVCVSVCACVVVCFWAPKRLGP